MCLPDTCPLRKASTWPPSLQPNMFQAGSSSKMCSSSTLRHTTMGCIYSDLVGCTSREKSDKLRMNSRSSLRRFPRRRPHSLLLQLMSTYRLRNLHTECRLLCFCTHRHCKLNRHSHPRRSTFPVYSYHSSSIQSKRRNYRLSTRCSSELPPSPLTLLHI